MQDHETMKEGSSGKSSNMDKNRERKEKAGDFKVTHQVPFNAVACFYCDGRTDIRTQYMRKVQENS